MKRKSNEFLDGIKRIYKELKPNDIFSLWLGIISTVLTLVTIILTVYINSITLKSAIEESQINASNFQTEINIQNEMINKQAQLIENLEKQIEQQEISNEEARKSNTLFLYKDLANIILTQPEFATIITKAYKSIDNEYMTSNIMETIEEMEMYAKSSILSNMKYQILRTSDGSKGNREIAISKILFMLEANTSFLKDYLELSIQYIQQDILNKEYGYSNILFIANKLSYLGSDKNSEFYGMYLKLIDEVQSKNNEIYLDPFYKALIKEFKND